MPWKGSYEELEQYLRRFVNFHGDPAPYDFVGVLTLWLALLDNLREHGIEDDFDQLVECLSEEQVTFIKKLASLAECKPTA